MAKKPTAQIDTSGETLTRVEAAKFLGVAPQTLANWSVTGERLTVYKPGKRAMYRKEELQEYLESRAKN